jgi:outer membrane protein assembly factor BamB
MTNHMCNRRIALVLACALCVGLAACSMLTTQGLKDMSSSPVPAKILTATSNQDCAGDGASPSIAPGWNLHWQKMFEHPIARPPLINGTQVFILEREDPSKISFKDKIFAVDPQTSVVQWSFMDVDNIEPNMLRQVKDIQWSQKYVALNILYTDTSSTSPATSYTIILDRATGQTIYREALNSSEILLSDDALYYRGAGFKELHRINLFTRQSSWAHQSGGKGPRGLFLVNSRLYAFHDDRSVYQYDPLSGTLVATATLNVVPGEHDVLVQNQTAVIRSWFPNGSIISFDFATLKTKWATAVSYTIQKPANVFLYDIPSVTVTSDSVYAFDAENHLLRLDLSTGNVIWTVPSPAPEIAAMSRVAVTGDLVYGLYSDGTVRAFSESDGSDAGTVVQVPLWYWKNTDTKEWRDLVGGLSVAGDTLIVTTGCRSVYAIQRGK